MGRIVNNLMGSFSSLQRLCQTTVSSCFGRLWKREISDSDQIGKVDHARREAIETVPKRKKEDLEAPTFNTKVSDLSESGWFSPKRETSSASKTPLIHQSGEVHAMSPGSVEEIMRKPIDFNGLSDGLTLNLPEFALDPEKIDINLEFWSKASFVQLSLKFSEDGSVFITVTPDRNESKSLNFEITDESFRAKFGFPQDRPLTFKEIIQLISNVICKPDGENIRPHPLRLMFENHPIDESTFQRILPALQARPEGMLSVGIERSYM